MAGNDRNIYVKLLEKRFAMIKAALLTRLSGLVY